MAAMSLSPIGLLFAAAVAVFLSLGQVTNKKVVEGQNVLAAVFWIRAFALPVFALVLAGFALGGSLPRIHAVAALKQEDLKDIPALAAQLNSPANAAVRLVAGRLSETTRKQLASYREGDSDGELARALRTDLNSNRIIAGELLYNERDFAGIPLSEETRHILSGKPRGEVRSYANRLLVDDLFAGAIAADSSSNLFGIKTLAVSPRMAFAIYLLIEIVLVAWSQYLNSLALKVAPISLCVPFTAFAPIFVIGSGYLVLGELPTIIGMMGISLIVVGGVLMHRKLFAVSWKAPIAAIMKDPGSRLMVLSVLLGAVFSPLEKQLILMSDALTAVFLYGAGTMIGLWILCLVLRTELTRVMRERPQWAVLSGLMDALMTIAQFVAVMYLPVVITMCIKRAGIVLTVLAGWLFFREREITDRLIGSMAMVGGIAIFYLPLGLAPASVLAAVVAAGLAIALYLTRSGVREHALKA
jgi:uncharacterized membrane protein